MAPPRRSQRSRQWRSDARALPTVEETAVLLVEPTPVERADEPLVSLDEAKRRLAEHFR